MICLYTGVAFPVVRCAHKFALLPAYLSEVSDNHGMQLLKWTNLQFIYIYINILVKISIELKEN